MSVKRIIEAKLGHALSLLPASPSIQPTRVFRVCYTESKKVGVIHVTPGDTAIYFDGLYCPFEEAALLVDRDVAADWGLIPRERGNDVR